MVVGYIVASFLLGWIISLGIVLPFLAFRSFKSVATGAAADIRGS